MATALRIGSRDHGRRFSRDELMFGEYESGYQYEVIDGRLYVSPKPNVPHDRVIQQTLAELNAYAFRKPSVVNYITPNARVFVPGSQFETVPEPDIAAYRDFPDEPETQWEDVSPILVVEVLGGEDDYKDQVRNVELYWRVPSISEYWLFDIRQDPMRPTLRVFRRGAGSEWEISDFGPDDVYSTSVLPGLKLPISPTKGRIRTRGRKR